MGPIQLQSSHQKSHQDYPWLRGGMGLPLCLLLWGVLNARLSAAAPHNPIQPHAWGSTGKVELQGNDHSSVALSSPWRTLKSESLLKSRWTSCCWPQPLSPASQPVLSLPHCTLTYTVPHQSVCEDTVRSSAKHLTKAEVTTTALPSPPSLSLQGKRLSVQFSMNSPSQIHADYSWSPSYPSFAWKWFPGGFSLPLSQGPRWGWLASLPQIDTLFPSSGISPSDPNPPKIIKSGLAVTSALQVQPISSHGTRNNEDPFP